MSSLIRFIFSSLFFGFLILGVFSATEYWKFRARFKQLYPRDWAQARKSVVFDGFLHGMLSDAAYIENGGAISDSVLLEQFERVKTLFKVQVLLLILLLIVALLSLS